MLYKYFLLFGGVAFSLLVLSFGAHVFNSDEVQFIFVLLLPVLLVSCQRNLCQIQYHEALPYVFF